MIHAPQSPLQAAPHDPLIFAIEDLAGSPQEIRRLDELHDHLQSWLEDGLGHGLRRADFDPEKNGHVRACDDITQAWQYQSPSLNLRNAGLANLPAVVGQLHHLEELDLSSNRFETLPPEIAQLGKLRLLRLSSNPLSSADWALLHSLRLESLTIDNSPLTDFPRELVDLAARGVKIRFAHHQLDDAAMASAERKLLRARALENVTFTSAIQQFVERLSRARSSGTHPYKSSHRPRQSARHAPIVRVEHGAPAFAATGLSATPHPQATRAFEG